VNVTPVSDNSIAELSIDLPPPCWPTCLVGPEQLDLLTYLKGSFSGGEEGLVQLISL
jgi:hypothetical protein